MVILPDDHTGYHFRTKDEKSERVNRWKKTTMKLFRWIAPPILFLLAYAVFIVIMVIISLKYKGNTGYGGVVECIVIGLLMWPIFPCLYSATLLRDCKHRICYTLYCSFFMGFGICIVSVLMGNNPGMEWLRICTGLFVWSEIGALLGLLRKRPPE